MRLASEFIDDYLEYLKGRGLSKSYGCVEKVIANDFLRYCGGKDMRELRKDDLYGYVLDLRRRTSQYNKPLSVGTVKRYATGASNFTNWLYRHGVLLVNPADGFEPPHGDPNAMRSVPGQEEMALILDTIETPRERTLFELIYSSGLRIGEARALEISDLKLEERTLTVRAGKGKKDRVVPFSQPAQAYLIQYIQGARNAMAQGLGENQRKYLFLQGDGKMSQWAVSMRWKEALARVGLTGKGYTIHGIRHACATHLLENGASVRYVQELLGHEKLGTTQRYTRPGCERIKAVYRTYHPRENERYEEVSAEYLEEVAKLKRDILESHAMKLAFYERDARRKALKAATATAP